MIDSCSVSPSPPLPTNCENPLKQEPMDDAIESNKPTEGNRPKMVNSETQTDESALQPEEETKREERKRKHQANGDGPVGGIDGIGSGNVGFGNKQNNSGGHCCQRKVRIYFGWNFWGEFKKIN